MIGMYMYGKEHPRMGQPYENRMNPFSTTAALWAKYGQSEADAEALLAAVEGRWGEFGGKPPKQRQKRAHIPNTPVTRLSHSRAFPAWLGIAILVITWLT